METVERPQRGFERSTGKVIPGEKGDAVLRTGEGRGGVGEDGRARSPWVNPAALRGPAPAAPPSVALSTSSVTKSQTRPR